MSLIGQTFVILDQTGTINAKSHRISQKAKINMSSVSETKERGFFLIINTSTCYFACCLSAQALQFFIDNDG